MSISLVSNPPYNIKWKHPPFVQLQSRFSEYEIPPESNANYVFAITALELTDDQAVFIFPMGALTSQPEQKVRENLVLKNKISYVIALPDGMFESTSIPVCVIGFSHTKTTNDVMMIDMRESYDVEVREQRGQFGGSSHTERVYKKEIKVLTNTEKALNAIKNLLDVDGFSRRVSIEDMRGNQWNLSPARYIGAQIESAKRREYSEIVFDINRIIKEKNLLKLTINATLAKSLGLKEVADLANTQPDINMAAKVVNQSIIPQEYIRLTKNAGEFSFANTSKTEVSSILLMILNVWKHHIFYLNEEENRYLVEFRDAILPELMSGKVNIDSNFTERGESNMNI